MGIRSLPINQVWTAQKLVVWYLPGWAGFYRSDPIFVKMGIRSLTRQPSLKFQGRYHPQMHAHGYCFPCLVPGSVVEHKTNLVSRPIAFMIKPPIPRSLKNPSTDSCQMNIESLPRICSTNLEIFVPENSAVL
jgi:hypothetical protein